MRTHVALPLLTATFFFAAVIRAWWGLLMSGSALLAVALAVAWLALLKAIVWRGRIEGIALLASIGTFLAAPAVGSGLAEAFPWSAAITQVALVECAMLALGATNVLVGHRQRSEAGRTLVDTLTVGSESALRGKTLRECEDTYHLFVFSHRPAGGDRQAPPDRSALIGEGDEVTVSVDRDRLDGLHAANDPAG